MPIGLLLIFPVASSFSISIYNNTAWAGPALREEAAAAAVIPPLGAFQSAELIGTVAPAKSAAIFSANRTAGLRLWVDGHLLLEDTSDSGTARRVEATIPLLPQATNRVLRLHLACTSPVGCNGPTQLLWNGDVVPAGPPLRGSQLEHEDLRRRLYSPQVPWQTYFGPSMTAHALMPSGLVLKLGLVDLATGEHLDEVRPFPRFQPAHVLPGRHSIDGSDLSSVTIQRWAPSPSEPPRNATVTITTTVEGSDLAVRGVCVGKDCGRIALNVSFACGWGRVCLPSTQTPTLVVGYPVGLPPGVARDVSVKNMIGAGHVGAIPASMERLAFPAYVCVGSSGSSRSPTDIDAMLVEAEKRCELSASFPVRVLLERSRVGTLRRPPHSTPRFRTNGLRACTTS